MLISAFQRTTAKQPNPFVVWARIPRGLVWKYWRENVLAESSVLILNVFKLQCWVKCSIKGTAYSPSMLHLKDSSERLYKSQRLIKNHTWHQWNTFSSSSSSSATDMFSCKKEERDRERMRLRHTWAMEHFLNKHLVMKPSLVYTPPLGEALLP